MTNDTYNGWANYETWNVALWIGNDEGLYNLAKEYRHRGYFELAVDLDCETDGTPDGVAWSDPNLDYDELDEMLEEL